MRAPKFRRDVIPGRDHPVIPCSRNQCANNITEVIRVNANSVCNTRNRWGTRRHRHPGSGV
jgi:hypothetical protein